MHRSEGPYAAPPPGAALIDPAAEAGRSGAAHLADRRYAAALAAFRLAAALAPHRASVWHNCGEALRGLASSGPATRAYRRALRLRPAYPKALSGLALIARTTGRGRAALRLLARAVAVDPTFAEGWSALAPALHDIRRTERAVTMLRRALRLKPDDAGGWQALAAGLAELDQATVAEACARRAVAVAPERTAAYGGYSGLCVHDGRLDHAQALNARMRRIEPMNADADSGDSVVRMLLGDFAGARALARRGVALAPDVATAYISLSLTEVGGAAHALARVGSERALIIEPNNDVARFNLSMTLLAHGEFTEGWRLYEARWRMRRTAPPAHAPLWDGGDPAGKTILLVAEQGHGDTLHFVRYAPMLAARGARVRIVAQPGLKRLLAGMPGVLSVHGVDETAPPCDLCAPLMSLPRLFGTTLGAVPATVPYLAGTGPDRDVWRGRLAGERRLKVGLVWAGDAHAGHVSATMVDRRRSLSLDALAPLGRVPGIAFYSLQKGPPAAQAAAPPSGLAIIDWMDSVKDFADTAAFVEQLDLVISVDTSVCHLAGALGKPVWVLSRFDACWRWLGNREDSPWYPTLRLFGQDSPGAWEPVVARAAAALGVWAEQACVARVDGANAEGWRRQGDAAFADRNFPAAADRYRRALALDPAFPAAFNNLGSALVGAGRPREADIAYRRAILLLPDYGDAWVNRAVAARDAGNGAAAIVHAMAAAVTRPDRPDGYATLADILRREAVDRADLAASERAVGQALAIWPDHPQALNTLGILRMDDGRMNEAVACFDRLLDQLPVQPDARFNRALALLKSGDFARGWEEYEWRWRTGQTPRPAVVSPLWTGEPLNGRSILLHAEQGHGDTLQFVRYAPLVAARGGRVVLAVQPALVRLLAGMPGVAAVHSLWDPLPVTDWQCPLLSLPRAFGAEDVTIPDTVPYLQPDPSDVARWRRRLPDDQRLRVGLVWSGDPRRATPHAHAVDRRRSLPYSALAPLAEVPGVLLVSLQMGEAATEQRTASTDVPLFDPMPDVRDFADTAAIIASLNLVITVDTAVAHLAGALGRPVWVLSRADGCWRWLTGRDDSPWYPSLTLFRQDELGSWEFVVARVRDQLQELAALRAEDVSTHGGAAARSTVPTHRPTRLRLEGVTLVCVDTAYPQASRLALRRTLELCDVAEAMLFTGDAVEEPGIRTVPIPPLRGLAAYSRFMVKELVRYIETPFILVVQWDGFVLDPRRWSDDFRRYDYVGARWKHHADGHDVGNGGFSLRSHRLLTALQDPVVSQFSVEDDAICRVYRPFLERHHGIVFAPSALADRFSHEWIDPGQPTFGFHGVGNLARHMTSPDLTRPLEALPDAALAHQGLTVLHRMLVAQRRFADARMLEHRIERVRPGMMNPGPHGLIDV